MLLIILILFKTSPAFSATTVQEAQSQIESGQGETAYSLLEKIEEQDPDFFSAWIELQKYHYSHNEWDRFFAYSTFYRQRYLGNLPSETLRKNFRARLIALEVLSLGKQCQWEAAESVGNFGIELAQKIGVASDVMEIEHALALVQLQSSYPKVKKAPNGAPIPHSIFKTDLYWPIQRKHINTLKHPRYLRLKLPNRCEEVRKKIYDDSNHK